MTDMRRGLILAAVGTKHLRDDAINQEVALELAHTLIKELRPRYAFCTGVSGWDGVWGAALMNSKVPYCMLLPYRNIGIDWYSGNRALLDTYISNAERVEYTNYNYTPTVYGDTTRYLLSNVEGLVTLQRPQARHAPWRALAGTYKAESCTDKTSSSDRVIAMATDLDIPVKEVWKQYTRILDKQEEETYDRYEAGISTSRHRASA
ncbi:hypothetical protein [Microcoleus phage My-WqHQDG]|nr:hypothetical protein [Microcoleus phage My-WqHQDG]